MTTPARSRGIRRVRAERSIVSRKLLLPAEMIIHNEVVSGVALLVAAMVALAWANSPWSASYYALQRLPISLSAGPWGIEQDVKHWVNDALMTVFFFVVGLEIKRELVRGELANMRHAALPFAGSLGGMVFPVLLYLAVNHDPEALQGWAIPMATDISFALSVLTVLGDGIPSQLRIVLLASAIVDDIGAIAVIVLFYNSHVSWTALGIAGFLLIMIIAMVRTGLRNPIVYLISGLCFWAAIHQSGIHATIAGVILGLLAPAASWFDDSAFADSMNDQIAQIQDAHERGDEETKEAIFGKIEELTRATEAPVDRLERLIHPWVSLVVLPLFALMNAGVTFSIERVYHAATSLVTIGVMAGLLIGKAVGIVAFSWTAVRLKLASLPEHVAWRHIGAIGLLGGIGFTVTLFITDLAFGGTENGEDAKIGILTSSILAGLSGYVFLRRFG